MKFLEAALIVGFSVGGAGCTTHIAPYTAKHRTFDKGEYSNNQPHPRGASLYASGGRGLYEDDRPNRVGDLVIIQVDEANAGQQDATTKLGSKNSNSVGLTGGIVAALQKAVPGVDLNKVLGTDSQYDFAGNGMVQRSGKLNATLPVRVRNLLPNNDLYIEGTKVVMVGNEEHHLYISGIVRQADLRADGSVLSSRVADAEIEYTGRGDVTDHQRPGWFSRVLRNVWPF